MGSKHDLLPSHLSKRGLKLVLQRVSLQTVAIVSGLLAGFLIGHLYSQHNQVGTTAAATAGSSSTIIFGGTYVQALHHLNCSASIA